MLIWIKSKAFDAWLHDLPDLKAKAQILARLNRASLGHFGDVAPVGDSVFEMRVHFGQGYRLYYVQHGKLVYVLLCGGAKKSQRRDIAKAKRLARDLKEQKP